MDYGRHSNGWLTFLENYGVILVLAISAFVSSQFLSFLSSFAGGRWIWCYAIGVSIGAAGAVLIFYSKIPLYRQRRFFTFGSAALPESRRSFYRLGYYCVFFAAILFLFLLVSRP